jgi:ribosomal protein L37AE/L43A
VSIKRWRAEVKQDHAQAMASKEQELAQLREENATLKAKLEQMQQPVSGVWLCAKCGYGGAEHAISGHPAYQCIADMQFVAARTATPAPAATHAQESEYDSHLYCLGKALETIAASSLPPPTRAGAKQ